MRAALLLLLSCLAVGAQPSYWFQQFQKQGNAQLAQEYFFRAGNGITITYTNPGPYVWINSTGTNYTIAVSTNAINAIYAQFATNWLGSNALYLLLSGQITNYTPGSNITFTLTSPHNYQIDSTATGGGGGDQVWTNDVANGQIYPLGSSYSSNLLSYGFSPWPIAFDTNYNALYLQNDDGTGTNTVSLVLQGAPNTSFISAQHYGWASFIVDYDGNISYIRNVNYSWPTANSTGSMTNDGVGNLGWSPVTGTTTGLTTNIFVVFGDGTTNELDFTNGLLMAMNGLAPHGPSWLWPGGGHILWPGGGYILLP